MKILMVLDHEFPPDPRVENEINSLTKAGHEIILACYTFQNRPTFEKSGSTNIYRKPISKFIYKSSVGILKFPFYFNFWKSFLDSLSETLEFDAIHIHDLPLAKIGYEFAKKHNIPFVLDLHENWPSLLETSEHANTFLGKILSTNKQWRKYEEKYTLLADYVITVVEEMKNRLCEFGLSKDKAIVLSNTFNLDNKFEIESQKTNENTILYYAGGINKHRGLQVVIKGLKQLVKQNKKIELWVVGSGKYVSTLKEMVDNYDLNNYIRFYGQKSFDETMELLSKSDIALIPHLKSEQTDNSSPNKLFQYMYFQKPVMVSDCTSLERVVNETNCGIVYKYDSPESFSKSAQSIIKSGLLNTFGRNGRKSVLDKYNWDESAIPFLEMYNSL
jgi:glycosyltransferase involved in cell wall biosynthesis